MSLGRPARAALLAALLTGCLGTGPAPEGPPAATDPAALLGWAERALPFGQGHDHFDPAQHANLSTPNFRVVGWDPLETRTTGGTAGGYFCGDARETPSGRRLAVVNSFYSGVAFVVADVTDPARPFMLGEMTLPYEYAYDMAMTPDGKHVVVGANPDSSRTGLPDAALPGLGLVGEARWRDACTGEERVVAPLGLPNGPSTILVSLADPANPAITDVQPAPVLGVHSVGASLVDGKTWVVSSVTNLQHQSSYFQFFHVEGDRLALQGVWSPPPPTGANQPVINGHVDAVVAKHPVVGKTVAYVADWDQGVVLLDLTNPAVPQPMSSFNPFTGGGGYLTGVETGNVHEAIPIDGLWDGRHYVLAGQEILGHPADHPTGWVWLLDDTDPTAIRLVGRWTLPVDVEWSMGLQFSTHYVTVVNRTAFVSLYHGGVWAFDLSTPENMRLPPSVGVFLPANVPPKPAKVGGVDVVGTPTVMENVALPNGDLVVFDGQSGLYVVRFDPTMEVPMPEPWPTARLPS